jgi:4-aminobutyrate aminotransferase-like enzyme
VKIARSFTGRQVVVVFDHTFHGRSLLKTSLTAKARPYKSGFGAFVSRAQHIGEIFKARLGNLAEQVPAVGEVRVIGAMAALEFVTNRQTKEPDPSAVSKILSACHAEGVILLNAGTTATPCAFSRRS